MLRRFLFLDNDTIEDYYSSISEEKSDNVNNINKFNKIYDYLNQNKEIKNEFILEDVAGKLNIGDIIQFNANIEVPLIYMQIKQIVNIIPNIEVAQRLGLLEMKTIEDINILNGIRGIEGIIQNQDIPIICEGVGKNEGIKLVSYLDDKSCRADLKNLTGRATILGKIKSIINKNKSIEVYNLLPEIQKFISNHEFVEEKSDFKEKIIGPALEIYVLAIYR